MRGLPKILLFASLALLVFAGVLFALGLCIAYFGSGTLGFDQLAVVLPTMEAAVLCAVVVAMAAIVMAVIVGERSARRGPGAGLPPGDSVEAGGEGAGSVRP